MRKLSSGRANQSTANIVIVMGVFLYKEKEIYPAQQYTAVYAYATAK